MREEGGYNLGSLHALSSGGVYVLFIYQLLSHMATLALLEAMRDI